jgi:phosphatidylinositol kinase/protein kinase (PI-3  family)
VHHQLRPLSYNGHLPGWRLMPVIVKANDDLRQEQFVSQLLFQFDSIFKAAGLPVWLRPYDILAVSPTGGAFVVSIVFLACCFRCEPWK